MTVKCRYIYVAPGLRAYPIPAVQKKRDRQERSFYVQAVHRWYMISNGFLFARVQWGLKECEHS